jgi:Tfp pilus assembly protein FimT
MNDTATLPILQKLIEDNAVGQLRRRDGLMARLGSEDGVLKLDWVEGVARLLADPTKLEEVEGEAREIVQDRGIRHIIWAGMGGSVIAVRVLHDLVFGGAPPSSSLLDTSQVTIYPLDSTDPAALNEIVRAIAKAKNLPLPASDASQHSQSAGTSLQPTFLSALLSDVMMIGVSMGMTSEEPITHLTWFTELLEQAQLSPAEHLLIMTLPGSYLDAFAREHQVPSRPLQLDGGTGTGGRMSAPATRVFLLPAALFLTTHFPDQPGQLRSVLRRAWDEYDLELATSRPAEHPFVRLAAAMSAASHKEACRLLVSMPSDWQAFVIWLEQLMEESLGKGGKGVVVFDDQSLNPGAPGYQKEGLLRASVVTEETRSEDEQSFILFQPSLASSDSRDRLAALAASFLGWQLSMALYGYLHLITFSGQPAVENYKTRARALRTQRDPLQVVANWQPVIRSGRLTLLAPIGSIDQDGQSQTDLSQQGFEAMDQGKDSSLVATAFARVLQRALASKNNMQRLEYLDLTINGEAPVNLLAVLDEHIHRLGNMLSGLPVKLRTAPAAYHSTEQSEMDGPPSLVSLRLVARNSEASLSGNYTNTFLHAQAVSTWQAMLEQKRPCFLLIIHGLLEDGIEPLSTFFSQVEKYVQKL